jgi:NADPH:quinone reductase-like Zn-dependent oxidoreductase
MKAFILDRYGGADGVRAGDVPDPELREDDVVIEVHAAGVNLLDSKIRNGEFKRILPYRLPLILGHDGVGIVVRSDLECDDSNPGDEVYAHLHHTNSVAATAVRAVLGLAQGFTTRRARLHFSSGGVAIVVTITMITTAEKSP